MVFVDWGMGFRFSFAVLVVVCCWALQVNGQVDFFPEGRLVSPYSTEWIRREPRVHFEPSYGNVKPVIRLDDHHIDIRQIRPFYCYPNVRRLDELCGAYLNLEEPPSNMPREIAFPNYYLPTLSGDTFALRESQFVLGEFRVWTNGVRVLLISDVKEACCTAIDAIAIDSDGRILDVDRVCDSGGDGGGSFETRLFYRDPQHYQFVEVDKFQYYDSPIDSIQYDRCYGDLYLHSDGMMERYVTKKDCTEVVRFLSRNGR